MARVMIIVITVAALLLFSGKLELVEATYDWTINAQQCSQDTYSSPDVGQEIDLVVNNLIQTTNPRPSPAYLCAVPDQTEAGPYTWGGSSCTDRIYQPDCTECLTYAKSLLYGYCPNRVGGYIVLGDCAMRYDNYAFCHY
ncbi:Antifungal protein ginkbilobin-like protein 2 [Linum perenne]